jgi:DNA-binding MarR family transcriptional regulator/N-acetylglutamate synthase-like GNAT family acetyltransferase
MTATAKASLATEQRVAAVRRFSRFYTRRIGVLQDHFLQSPFSLAEARVLYELAHRDKPTATELVGNLELDPGYLSRILRGFGERGLVVKARSTDDRRQSRLAITAKGRKAYAPLERRSHDDVADMLAALSPADQDRLVTAMATIEHLIGGGRPDRPAYALRPPRPGDMGWVVARHGALYAQEHGWGVRFEGLVAEIVARFIETCDPTRERCWIADVDGEPAGSVFLVKDSNKIARLRLLLVEPEARGVGIGARLIEECVRFARAAGYAKITLWTQSVLVGARRLYQRAGFKRVATERHAEFGIKLVGETWELSL